MTLKVLDVNDPKKILVDPPKPEWMKKKEAEDAKDKKKKRRWGKKKKGDETEKPLKKSDVPKEDKTSTNDANANFTAESDQ